MHEMANHVLMRNVFFDEDNVHTVGSQNSPYGRAIDNCLEVGAANNKLHILYKDGDGATPPTAPLPTT